MVGIEFLASKLRRSRTATFTEHERKESLALSHVTISHIQSCYFPPCITLALHSTGIDSIDSTESKYSQSAIGCVVIPRSSSSITISTTAKKGRGGSATKIHFMTLQGTLSVIIKSMQAMFWHHAMLRLTTAVPKFLFVIIPELDGELR